MLPHRPLQQPLLIRCAIHRIAERRHRVAVLLCFHRHRPTSFSTAVTELFRHYRLVGVTNGTVHAVISDHDAHLYEGVGAEVVLSDEALPVAFEFKDVGVVLDNQIGEFCFREEYSAADLLHVLVGALLLLLLLRLWLRWLLLLLLLLLLRWWLLLWLLLPVTNTLSR